MFLRRWDGIIHISQSENFGQYLISQKVKVILVLMSYVLINSSISVVTDFIRIGSNSMDLLYKNYHGIPNHLVDTVVIDPDDDSDDDDSDDDDSDAGILQRSNYKRPSSPSRYGMSWFPLFPLYF